MTFGDSIYRSAGLIDSCSGWGCLRRVTVVALVITRGGARRVGHHLTTAWVEQGVE